MAIQRYIFDTWSKTAELFGFERYDASILEPSELYRAKSSEEIVNEQTYTFTDRGDREVTLRPEMTPTVARMVAGKRRELIFPLRWYSILFGGTRLIASRSSCSLCLQRQLYQR